MAETIGELVRRRRLELGLSQDELASRLGMTGSARRTSVMEMERRPPRWMLTSTVRRYAQALEIPEEELRGVLDAGSLPAPREYLERIGVPASEVDALVEGIERVVPPPSRS